MSIMWTRRVFVFAAAALLSLGAADKRFIIVLIGPTGSGKTTQSEFLQRKFGIPTISADDLAKQNPSELAKHREAGIDPGTPIANPALNDLVRDRLSKMDLTKGVALDGYPSTKDQADHLAALVRNLGLPSPVIFHLEVPDEVVRKRLDKRKRDDDTPAQVERRLKDYHRELEMIKSYYPEANIWTIDGTRPPAEVSKTIQAVLADELPKRP
jgi:adenylate kinase